jgi:hypothetical protein
MNNVFEWLEEALSELLEGDAVDPGYQSGPDCHFQPIEYTDGEIEALGFRRDNALVLVKEYLFKRATLGGLMKCY